MHPVVKQKYEEANFDMPPNEVANSNNEEAFAAKVKIAKKPVTHKIIKVVRTRIKNKEYVYYQETLQSRDFLNNFIDHTHTVGKYEDPEFVTQIDPKTNTPRATEIQGFTTVYEFPWVPNIVDQWLTQDGFELDDICGFMVKDGGRTYGGYPQDQFCNESYDNLVTLGKYGTLNPAAITKEIQKRTARQTAQPSG